MVLVAYHDAHDLLQGLAERKLSQDEADGRSSSPVSAASIASPRTQ
jgi:hypothetical protein